MDTTADPTAMEPQPGSLAHWLAAHPGLGGEALAGLVALIEPLGSQAAIKAVATGRYVLPARAWRRCSSARPSSAIPTPNC